jgi:hypothetical protein
MAATVIATPVSIAEFITRHCEPIAFLFDVVR